MTKECYVHSKISLFSEVILVLQVMRHTWSTHLVLCLSFPLASCLNICTQMFYIKKLKMLKNKYSNFHFILTEIIFVLWFQHHVAFVEARCGWWVTPATPMQQWQWCQHEGISMHCRSNLCWYLYCEIPCMLSKEHCDKVLLLYKKIQK